MPATFTVFQFFVQLVQQGLPLILPTLVSTGLITGYLVHSFDKKLRTHEIKIQKYMRLVEELAKFATNDPDYTSLMSSLNEALFFASDEVVGEILEFNKKVAQLQADADGKGFHIPFADMQPLVVAIRKELYLKSKSIDKKGLTFFQKSKN